MSNSNLKLAQPVLARDDDAEIWSLDFFSHYNEKEHYPYICLNYAWRQCLPLEGNEHFHNTKDKPTAPWTPKYGEAVFVRDGDGEPWVIRLFMEKVGDKYVTSTCETMTHAFLWSQCKPYKPVCKDE